MIEHLCFFVIISGRPILQAKRTQPSFQQRAGPALYTGAPSDVLSHSTDFVYEEVSNLSPPMAQLQGVDSQGYLLESQQQAIVIGSQGGGNMSAAAPYNNVTMMAGSPQNVSQAPISQFRSASLSPQQHQLHPGSPQNNFIPQQMAAGSQMQSIPVTESLISSMQNAQIESELQMTINDLKIEPVSQPVQVSPLQQENLEMDFLMPNAQLNSLIQNTDFDQFNQVANQYMENKNTYNYGGGYSNQSFVHQTCGYSARGSQNHDLQDVIEVLDMVDGAPPRGEPCEDYDEVDCARLDNFDMSGLTPRSAMSALKQTVQVEPEIMKPKTVTEKEVKPEPYTRSVTSQTQTMSKEPAIGKKTVVTRETSAQAETSRKTSTSGKNLNSSRQEYKQVCFGFLNHLGIM